MLMPNVVDAATFSYNDVNYVLEEKVISCSLSEKAYLIGKTDDYYILFEEVDTVNGKLYKVDFSNNCTQFTDQEYYDFMSQTSYKYKIVGNKIVKDIEVFEAFFKTTDTSINDNKTYYFSQGNGFSIVASPDLSRISRYYEKENFVVYPALATIDENLTYYSYYLLTGSGPILNEAKVSELTSLDVYYVKYDESSGIMATINETKFDSLENLGVIKVNDADEYFLIDASGNVYDINGNFIEELNHVSTISKIMDNLLLVYYSSTGSSKILNSDYEEVYDLEFNSSLVSCGSSLDDNLDYIISYSNESSPKTYELRNYKEENITSHTFNNNDLIFTFSGEYSKLSSVKVNNVELNTNDYMKTNGSTIITLKKEYLSTLKDGTYTLSVEYSDGGIANSTFDISTINPQTGDGIMSSILIGSASIIGLLVIAMYLKNNERFN